VSVFSLGVALLANAPEQMPSDRLRKKVLEDASVMQFSLIQGFVMLKRVAKGRCYKVACAMRYVMTAVGM